jgi:hypothetical protein
MIRIVDRREDFVVQKVIDRKHKAVGYQIVLDGVHDAERIIRWIMVGIVAWGLFHAIGAWRLNHDPRRMLVVLGCVAAFLGFWLTMLAAWRRARS